MIALLSLTVDGARRRAEAIAGSGDEEEAALADRASSPAYEVLPHPHGAC